MASAGVPVNAILIRGATAIMTGMIEPSRATGPDIRIRGSKITAIGKLGAEPGERVIDATGCIVYPGWINTHHHLMQTLLRGVPDGLNAPLRKWLDAVPFAFRMRFDEEMLETAALLGLAELMLSGCTTVADFHHLYYPGIAFELVGGNFQGCRAAWHSAGAMPSLRFTRPRQRVSDDHAARTAVLGIYRH